MASLDQFTKQNKYLMLAFDHRGSFKKLVNPQNPESVSDERLIELKKEIICSLKGLFSSILIDVELGLKAYSEKETPFLLPIEKSGFKDEGGERLTEIEYSVKQLKEFGASGAKLLLYFNPFLKTTSQQIEIAKKVVTECKSEDFPLFLEIVTYEPDHDPSMEEREKLIMESLKMLTRDGVHPDVFKLEYPGSPLGCQTITAILGHIPWIMLSRGESFDNFKKQLEEASIRGCQGFLAGRSLWQEVCRLQGAEKQDFLQSKLGERFEEISEIFIAS